MPLIASTSPAENAYAQYKAIAAQLDRDVLRAIQGFERGAAADVMAGYTQSIRTARDALSGFAAVEGIAAQAIRVENDPRYDFPAEHAALVVLVNGMLRTAKSLLERAFLKGFEDGVPIYNTFTPGQLLVFRRDLKGISDHITSE